MSPGRLEIMLYENTRFDDIFGRLENGTKTVSMVGLNQAARAYFTARAYQALRYRSNIGGGGKVQFGPPLFS